MDKKNFEITDALLDKALYMMELMGVDSGDRMDFKADRKVSFKTVVCDEEKSIRKMPVTEDEVKMIKKTEEEYGVICYYLSKDRGIMPDGTKFNRYTLFYTSGDRSEFLLVKDYNIVPAYVINMEIPEFSELCECEYRNIKGLIINVS